jgi:hypothetical protein
MAMRSNRMNQAELERAICTKRLPLFGEFEECPLIMSGLIRFFALSNVLIFTRASPPPLIEGVETRFLTGLRTRSTDTSSLTRRKQMLTMEPSAPRSIDDTAEMGIRITDMPSTLYTADGNCELSNHTGCCSDEKQVGADRGRLCGP